METTIGLERQYIPDILENGKENGNHYSILGLYRGYIEIISG